MMNKMFRKSTMFPLVFVAFLNLATLCQCQGVDKELTLTRKQKMIFDEFKKEIFPNLDLTHDYMKEDSYLIRFLRASRFDLKTTEKKLIETMKWRAKNKMDTIIYEDWSAFEEQFPYYVEGCDKDGRPVFSVIVGEWDVRKAVLSGQRDQLIRYSYKIWEEIAILIREGQSRGKNITQYVYLMEMSDFNLVQSACPACIPVHTNLIMTFEKYFPRITYQTIIVNAPQVYQDSFNLFKPFMSAQLRRSLNVFGSNQNSWQTWLFQQIPKSQLTQRFGGNKQDAMSPRELRTSSMIYPC